MSLIVALPVLVPLSAACICLLAHRRPLLQRWISMGASLGLLAAAVGLLHVVGAHGVQAMAMGGWPGPFGIVLAADLLTALMVAATAVVAVCTAVFSLGTRDGPHEGLNHHALVQVLLAGVCGAFLTTDLFNLFVWFEVLLIASFVLMALGNGRLQLEGTVKYVAMNLFASILFLAAVALLYAMAGTLNMAHLALRLPELGRPELVTAVGMLLLAAFAMKSAVFPLFFWLPASYHTPPVAVTALFGGLLTKVGVYALYRAYTLFLGHDPGFTHAVLLWVAVLTMVTGVLGAVAQYDFRRLLAFHIISQIGYMVLGLALVAYARSDAVAALALAGGIFHILHNMVVKTNLFYVSGVAARIQGTYRLERLGGLYRSHPYLSLLFLVSALALAGIPPLSGFWSKYALVRAGLEAHAYVAVAAALAVGLLTLYSMTKIWNLAFWKPRPEATASRPVRPGTHAAALLAPVALLAMLAALIGFFPSLLFDLCMGAARQLLDPSEYIAAVLEATDAGGVP